MGAFIDLTGQRFGKWLVESRAPNKGCNTMWYCVCDCGTRSAVCSTNIRGGLSTRCETCRRKALTTHGLGTHHLYPAFLGMMGRCNNPKNPQYPNYGGRGIEVYAPLDTMTGYVEHVTTLANYGEPGYSLDRIDNDGGYAVGNLRWADRTAQNRNARSNRMLTHEGRVMCMTAWAVEVGMAPDTLRARLNNGWDTARALTQPVRE